nr:immunoglobulin heavy chain junction region [Macaca mulatta]
CARTECSRGVCYFDYW